MARSSPLSKRQRRAQRKTTPKAARVTPVFGVVVKAAVEPRGQALREAVADRVEAVERCRLGGEAAKVLTSTERGLEGYVRATSRDGLTALYHSTALTPVQVKAGLAFRMCYEAAGKGLGSGLGNAGEGGGSRKVAALGRSAAELHRAYVLARLNQMERAVGAELVDGRELHALRMIAGEGHTVREVAGSSGHARAATTAALARALDAIARALRITGQ